LLIFAREEKLHHRDQRNAAVEFSKDDSVNPGFRKDSWCQSRWSPASLSFFFFCSRACSCCT